MATIETKQNPEWVDDGKTLKDSLIRVCSEDGTLVEVTFRHAQGIDNVATCENGHEWRQPWSLGSGWIQRRY